MTADVGPAHLVLTATVARRYYLDGKSKIEIADEFSHINPLAHGPMLI